MSVKKGKKEDLANKSDIINEIKLKEETKENDIIPKMEIKTSIQEEKNNCLVKDEELLGIYNEILDNCRKDRECIDEILMNFIDMVLNNGDASSASKEAIVNLMKIKSDTSDKMAKIADLMTRIKLKDKDTFPRYLAAQQNNKVIIETNKRDIIKSVNKLLKEKMKDENK